MAKSFSRSKRVAEQIQRTLSELIRRELRDPRLGSVTIIDVQVNHDMSAAKVFYSILGGNKDPQLTQEIMDEGAKLLRGPLGRSLGLRHAPQLTFVADELIDYGTKLTTAINEAVKSDVSRHKDDESN
ncbi:MAG: 30S ribosome-binding factor RbfA [Steroidobacteraceae bacterium]